MSFVAAPYWESPTIGTRNYIVDTEREVVVVDAEPCARVYQGREWEMASICGLVLGHKGSHWQCSQDLVRESGGAFAVVVKR